MNKLINIINKKIYLIYINIFFTVFYFNVAKIATMKLKIATMKLKILIIIQRKY